MRRWWPVALVCSAIFLLSRDSASSEHSTRVLGWILSWFHADTPARLARLTVPFRKAAHVSVYGLLAFTAFRAFGLGKNGWSKWSTVWRSLAFCSFYAATDEFHQRFIPHRIPSLRDVGIDTGGAFLALLLLHFVASRRRRPKPPGRAESSLKFPTALATNHE